MNESLAVAVFNTHLEAEEAIMELKNAGYDMTKLSIVGKDYHTEENVLGFYNIGDRVKFWGKLGLFWGGLLGLLFGSALLVVPGVGHLIILGPLAGWILGAVENAVVVGGFSALGAALYSVGIPKDSILKYEAAIKTDGFLVIAHGTAEDVQKAKSILSAKSANGTDLHIK